MSKCTECVEKSNDKTVKGNGDNNDTHIKTSKLLTAMSRALCTINYSELCMSSLPFVVKSYRQRAVLSSSIVIVGQMLTIAIVDVAAFLRL